MVRRKGNTAEERLAALAGRSHGVVTRAESLRAGVTEAEIRHRVRVGSLIRIDRGVYRVGHLAPSLEARYMGAVKRCGERAILAGRAAGYLFGLIKGSAPRPEVITPSHPRAAGILIHRAEIEPEDVTRWRGIPVTTVPRTLVDLAALIPEPMLARACHEAAVRHRTTPDKVERVLDRRRNWPGARELRRVLSGDERVTLSKLEARFLDLLRKSGLPLPEMNALVDGRRVDCHWPAHRLTVELDGYRYHHTRHAWEQDRRREREARARGDEFRRYTSGDVVEEPTAMLTELRALLGADPVR